MRISDLMGIVMLVIWWE